MLLEHDAEHPVLRKQSHGVIQLTAVNEIRKSHGKISVFTQSAGQ